MGREARAADARRREALLPTGLRRSPRPRAIASPDRQPPPPAVRLAVAAAVHAVMPPASDPMPALEFVALRAAVGALVASYVVNRDDPTSPRTDRDYGVFAGDLAVRPDPDSGLWLTVGHAWFGRLHQNGQVEYADLASVDYPAWAAAGDAAWGCPPPPALWDWQERLLPGVADGRAAPAVVPRFCPEATERVQGRLADRMPSIEALARAALALIPSEVARAR